MTEKIKKLLLQLQEKTYRTQRTATAPDLEPFTDAGSVVRNFGKILASEDLILYNGDDFGFNRSFEGDWLNCDGNLTPNYGRMIGQGFDTVIRQIEQRISETDDLDKIAYGNAMKQSIALCLAFSDRYRAYAKAQGNEKLYRSLCRVPHGKAESFYEACVFIKLCIYFLRRQFTYHIGLGRFDQYMYPYYLRDKANGVTDEEILETIEAFFIAQNRDADLYFGVQQGDNGQSMTLGGYDADGNCVYNELSHMCMEASLELNLIDPKINLRVSKDTPDDIYVFATQLTKQGLGFPQYCNDDVVIPGLIKLGYTPEDAVDYTVAACWEFIIPGKSADCPNKTAMNFPLVVSRVIREKLTECTCFESLMQQAEAAIAAECDILIEKAAAEGLGLTPAPLFSVFFDGCIESLTDMWSGGTKYRNLGCHGAGIANAADALAAVKQHIYEEKTVSKAILLQALEQNFEGFDSLRNQLRNSPKMGNNDDFVDDIALRLMDAFARNLNNRPNGGGGIWRAGTGSAQGYILYSKECPATADGRKAGEPYSSSFSPALDARTNGILSVLQSFTKYDLTNIINGGPLTIEIHDTVLRNDIGIEKTAMLVKTFILLGGHQLQLNSISRERLIDAQKHPEKYPNLIVRVWGWSGYFNELDVAYQNHIIRRCAFTG